MAMLCGGLYFHKRFTTAEKFQRKNDECLTLQATEILKSFYDSIANFVEEEKDKNTVYLVEELKRKMGAIHTSLKAYGLNPEEITKKLQLQLTS